MDKLREDIVFEERMLGRTFAFRSTWGLFNPRCLDEGSRLLIRHLEVPTDHRCIDIGCGYGAIGLALAHLCPDGEVDMVDKDFVAVEYANKNVAGNGLANARAYLSNGFSEVPDVLFDTVVSNLPAKAGNEMLSILLGDAHRYLRVGGTLWVVTHAGLKAYIKRAFLEIFGNYEKVKQGRTHSVARALKV